MAAAYAAFNSLMNLITQLKEHPQPPIILAEEHVVSLNSKICFFKMFLKDNHNTIDHGLEMRIADAAHAAEDLIETCIADRILDKRDFDKTTQRHVEELDLIAKEMTEMNQNEENQGGGISVSVEIAYAALKSAMRVLERILEQPWAQVMFYKKRADSLCAKIHVLLEFLENHGTLDAEWVTRIEKEASDVQYNIDSHGEQLHLALKDFYGDLRRVIESMDVIEKEITEMIQNEQSQGHDPHSKPLTPSPSLSATSGEEIVIGIEATVNQVMSRLTLQQKSGRKIISISGMGGIGKTTLAREVYNNTYITNYFDVRAWATISKDYKSRKSLEEILLCLDKKESKESLSKMEEHELGHQLHKHLFHRRYLIILDDLWDAIAWERLRSFFPDSSNSAIVITTRESTIASIGSHRFVMDMLDENISWDLFCRKVFGEVSCPVELEEVGKKITNKCRGLPLAIVVIGGHLAKSIRTLEYWEYIANNLSSVANAEDSGHCFKVLYSSYAHLPVHLKPCFLYLAIFPEDEDIRVSQLIKLWMAEGFLEPIYCNNPEENAKRYLHDLIGRNLIFASMFSPRGKVSRCKIHDLLRDLCLKEALEKKFVHVAHDQGDMKVIKTIRRIVLPPSTSRSETAISSYLRNSEALRTLIFTGELTSVSGKLLRVLAPVTAFSSFHHELHDMSCSVNVRYFHPATTYFKHYHLPSSIFLLWNLQYLFIKAIRREEAPPEIWEMSQLRTMHIEGIIRGGRKDPQHQEIGGDI